MHLKNMALLKIAEHGEMQFRSVRMAPLYDAVTTRVFPNLKHDRMALKLNGKDDNLRRADFRALATTAGLRTGDADAAMDDMLKQIGGAIDRISLPNSIEPTADARKIVEDTLNICRNRVGAIS